VFLVRRGNRGLRVKKRGFEVLCPAAAGRFEGWIPAPRSGSGTGSAGMTKGREDDGVVGAVSDRDSRGRGYRESEFAPTAASLLPQRRCG